MKNIIFLFFIILALPYQLEAQITFMKTFGGTGDDILVSGLLTNDESYLGLGYTDSFGAGGTDAFVIKVDSLGNEVWSKTIGGTNNDGFSHGIELSNGDFILVGYTNSFGAGDYDAFVVRLSSTGNIIWTKTYGGTDNDKVATVLVTANNNLLISGYTKSFGAGGLDALVLKVDMNGNLIWAKSYGESTNDWLKMTGISETASGNYIAVGSSEYSTLPQHSGLRFEIDSAGNLVSSNMYSGANNDGFTENMIANNTNYVRGSTTSWNGNGNFYSLWMSQIDVNNNLIWSNTYGMPNESLGMTGGVFHNNTITFAGYTFTNNTQNTALILQISPSGNINWAKSYGGNGVDRFRSINKTSTGYILFGYTDSYGQGGKDILFVKTDNQGEVQGCSNTINMTKTTVSPNTSTPSLLTQSSTLGQNENPSIITSNFSAILACSPMVIADFERGDSVICQNDCVNITDNSTNAMTWNWTIRGANNSVSSNQNLNNICFPNVGTDTITLIVSNSLGNDTLTKIITIFPSPTVNLGNDTTIYTTQSLTLNATFPNATYLWSDNTTNATLIVNSGDQYWVEVSLGNCTTKGTIQISTINPPFIDLENDSCNLFIPNAFTPNNDGKNDIFQVLVPSSGCNTLGSYSMHIFDRWGELVYQSNNINDSWDGTFRGQKIKMGVYVWLIKYNDGFKDYLKKGDVLILR